MDIFKGRIAGVLWAAAALVIFPYFIPNSYLFWLFGVRLCASAVFMVAAVIGFRSAAKTARRVPVSLRLGAAVVAVAAGIYVVMQGPLLIQPDDTHILGLIKAGLQQQGAQVATEYQDIAVSGSRCMISYSKIPEWDCSYNTSYKLASSGKSFANEAQSAMRISSVTGGELHTYACEYDFQWSQRLRATSLYASDAEPVRWGGCKNDNENKYFYNTIRARDGITVKIPQNMPAAQLKLALPESYYAESFVKDLYQFKRGGTVTEVKCEHLADDTTALGVPCTVSGQMVVWQDNSLAALGMNQEVRGDFTDKVVLYAEDLKWNVKRAY